MTQALAIGSLQDVAQNEGRPLAETFMSVDCLIMLDISLSMNTEDCADQQRRHSLAVRELRRLQANIPGKVGVVQFHSFPEFIPGGIPDEPTGGTNIAGCLEFVKPVDGTGIRLILISDGEPDNSSAALSVAAKFKSKIETVYIGPEGGNGAEFLRRLAQVTGGVAVTQSVAQIPKLAQTITRMLRA